MNGRWDVTLRLAGPIARRPMRIALGALLISALGVVGLARFGVDSGLALEGRGPSLLVGSQSSTAQTYRAFSQTFGAGAIVVSFGADNASAPYLEPNLRRLSALELDLAHDPRVASVLGPGTVAASLTEAAVADVNRALTEYPYFIAETDSLGQIAGGSGSSTQLAQRFQAVYTSAQQALELALVAAVRDAILARVNYQSTAGARILDSQEKAVDAALAKETLPPLWAQYVAGPGQTPNNTQAQSVFTRYAAAYGVCDPAIAGLLKIPTDCQPFFERSLLDLPACPTIGSKGVFCSPKAQWASVLPAPQPGGPTYLVISVRLKPQYATDATQVEAVRTKILDNLRKGVNDEKFAYPRELRGKASFLDALSSQSRATLKALGALQPTECAGESSSQNSACRQAFKDAPMTMVMGAGPLLAVAAGDSLRALLAIALPGCAVVILIVLVAVFRARGRLWPYVSGVVAAAFTAGLTLWSGAPLNPAVTAALPIVVAAGAGYGVLLVSRYHEARDDAVDSEGALRAALGRAPDAALMPALLTVAALAALALLSGIDWGPLSAAPATAQLALVLAIGIAVAWITAVLVALPLAVAVERPRGGGAARPSAADRRSEPPAAQRTLAVADNWLGVVAPLTVIAIAGWALLHALPVQTQSDQLMNGSIPAVGQARTAEFEAGFEQELDIYLRGTVVTGPFDAQTGLPAHVEWQCQAAHDILAGHEGAVVQAVSIGDLFIGSGTQTGGASAPACVSGSSSAGSVPSPSASPSPSPSAVRSSRGSGSAIEASNHVPAVVAATSASASPTAAPSPLPSASASASSGATPTPSGAPRASSKPVTQTLFLCDLRLLPLLSRTLVMDIPDAEVAKRVGPDNPPCPPVDKYRASFLDVDSGPINPSAARIVLGVEPGSAADESRLVDSLGAEVARAPSGIKAAPVGIGALEGSAYDVIGGRAYLFNAAPLAVIGVLLLLLYRDPLRALLPLLPAALATGWTVLLMLLLGRLPGSSGATLGALNPLTTAAAAVTGALGIAVSFLLVDRFRSLRERGAAPEDAAAETLAALGRPLRSWTLLLVAALAALAASGLLPDGSPMLAAFGLVGAIAVALNAAAAFLLILPLAIALDRRGAPPVAPTPRRGAVRTAAPQQPRRRPGVSGRARPRGRRGGGVP